MCPWILNIFRLSYDCIATKLSGGDGAQRNPRQCSALVMSEDHGSGPVGNEVGEDLARIRPATWRAIVRTSTPAVPMPRIAATSSSSVRAEAPQALTVHVE